MFISKRTGKILSNTQILRWKDLLKITIEPWQNIEYSFRLGLTTRALFACRLPVEVFITFTLIHYYVHQDLTEVRQLYSKLTSIIIFFSYLTQVNHWLKLSYIINIHSFIKCEAIIVVLNFCHMEYLFISG